MHRIGARKLLVQPYGALERRPCRSFACARWTLDRSSKRIIIGPPRSSRRCDAALINARHDRLGMPPYYPRVDPSTHGEDACEPAIRRLRPGVISIVPR